MIRSHSYASLLIALQTNVWGKSFITLFLLAITVVSKSQENPFEEFGYTPRIATLSGGKYVEYFDRDTIVQIGSVIYNTKSKKIVGFVEQDTAYSEATLQPDIVSRWMSPDPLAYEAPGWSPYRFGYNNPIYWTDPTGLLEDNYTVDDDGNVELAEKTDDNFDMVYKKSDYEHGNMDNGLKVNDRGLLPSLAENTGIKAPYSGNSINYAVSTSKTDAFNFFKYASDNTNVEWSLEGYVNNGEKNYVLATQHSEDAAVRTESYVPGFDLYNQNFSIHSHPNDIKPGASNKAGLYNDQSVFTDKYYSLQGRRKPAPHYVYNPTLGKLYNYDSWKSDRFIRNVKTGSDLHRKLGF